jgi:hypothetical protein
MKIVFATNMIKAYGKINESNKLSISCLACDLYLINSCKIQTEIKQST